jgi:hypothetical protein
VRAALLAAVLSLPALAGGEPEPCPKPKPLTCEQIRALEAKRCEPEAPEVRIVDHRVEVPVPCPPSVPATETPPTVVTEYVTVPPPDPPREPLRPILGAGLQYGETHKLGAHVFSGIQFPRGKSGENWQWQIGVDYSPHSDVDATCRIGCKTCKIDQPGAGPWGLRTSAVVVF